MPCCIRMSPIMYVITVYAVYMLFVFPITELICWIIRNYTDIDPQHHYQMSRWIYLALLITFMPCYFFAFYLSWRKHRAKPLFTPKWKVTDDLEEDDFLCTICYDLVVEPHTLRCQHSFCKKCITQCLRLTRKCPSCQQWVYLCTPNDELKAKVLRWVKDNGREEEYEEIIHIRRGMKMQKRNCAARFCALIEPFFEFPDAQPIRLRPIRRAAVEPVAACDPEPLVVNIIDEFEVPPCNPVPSPPVSVEDVSPAEIAEVFLSSLLAQSDDN
ncbi:unnamed protein product [Caenorhabditis sp. 36 PRJEB53466]|nr:unnamed protein product [Caenorhabditis sp. 36 PRJEB53466]